MIFPVKTALWLLKPVTWDWTFFRVLALGTFGSRVRIRKLIGKQLFSTSWKYCLWYKAVTKFHLHSIYYICLDGLILLLNISLLKVLFMFYDNNILLCTFEKLCLNLNARSFFIVKNVSKSCKEGAALTPAVPKLPLQLTSIDNLFVGPFKKWHWSNKGLEIT